MSSIPASPCDNVHSSQPETLQPSPVKSTNLDHDNTVISSIEHDAEAPVPIQNENPTTDEIEKDDDSNAHVNSQPGEQEDAQLEVDGEIEVEQDSEDENIASSRKIGKKDRTNQVPKSKRRKVQPSICLSLHHIGVLNALVHRGPKGSNLNGIKSSFSALKNDSMFSSEIFGTQEKAAQSMVRVKISLKALEQKGIVFKESSVRYKIKGGIPAGVKLVNSFSKPKPATTKATTKKKANAQKKTEKKVGSPHSKKKTNAKKTSSPDKNKSCHRGKIAQQCISAMARLGEARQGGSTLASIKKAIEQNDGKELSSLQTTLIKKQLSVLRDSGVISEGSSKARFKLTSKTAKALLA